MGLTVTAEDV